MARAGNAVSPSTPRRHATRYAKINQIAHAIVAARVPVRPTTSANVINSCTSIALPKDRFHQRGQHYEPCGKVVVAKTERDLCEVRLLPWTTESDLAGLGYPDLGGGYRASREMTWRYKPEADEPAIEVVFELNGAGVLRCRSVTFEAAEAGREVRHSDLRLPLEDMADWFREAVTKVSEPSEAGWVKITMPSADERPAIRKRLDQARSGARRRAATDARLREVARVYREAVASGSPPTQAVQTYLRRSHRTASDYVRRARDLGFLGPSLGPGRVGELLDNEVEDVDGEGA